MADALMTVDVDTSVLDRAFDTLTADLRRRLNEVARVTAAAVVREARARLARQLSGRATGKTVAGIHAVPAYDGNGFVILSDRGYVPGEPEQIPNLPLWLEKGTRPGRRRNYARTRPRPFFYASIELEAGAHERRVLDALRDAADASGLGS